MKKKILLACLALSALASPSFLYAQQVPFTPEFRSALLQLIILLQKLQALKQQPVPTPIVRSIVPTPPSVPAPQQALPFLEGFALPSSPPKSSVLHIDLVEPSSGPSGTTVTFHGKFTSHMTLYTSYSVESISSPDGKTFSIVVTSPFSYAVGGNHGRVPLSFYLEDSSGISNEGRFTIVY